MGILGNLTGFGGRDMAVDLGIANPRVYARGRGIVRAINRNNHRRRGVGAHA